MTLAPAMASSMSLTDDSRATASGMNEFGKQHGVAQRQHRHFGRHGVRALARRPAGTRVVWSLMASPLPPEPAKLASLPARPRRVADQRLLYA